MLQLRHVSDFTLLGRPRPHLVHFISLELDLAWLSPWISLFQLPGMVRLVRLVLVDRSKSANHRSKKSAAVNPHPSFRVCLSGNTEQIKKQAFEGATSHYICMRRHRKLEADFQQEKKHKDEMLAMLKKCSWKIKIMR